MDIAAQIALHDYRREPTNENAARLAAVLDRAGMLPDSPGAERTPVQPVTFEPQGANVATVTTNEGRGLLSYGVLVAWAPFGSGPVYRTDNPYSKTTSAHVNKWLRPFSSRETVKVAESIMSHALRLVQVDRAWQPQPAEVAK